MAHIVYSSGEWKKADVNGETCDRHPSARAVARVLFPNLCLLYFCGHCIRTQPLTGQYHVTYEAVTV